jgi:hypothetical protein
MNKKLIRLTESDLHRIVKRSVNKVLRESSFIDNDVRLSLELYRDGNGFGIWLSDNLGGSGIKATGNTPEEAANNIASYIADYFYGRDGAYAAINPTLQDHCRH